VGGPGGQRANGQRKPLTPPEQEAVNTAIERGVRALKLLQGPLGTWAKPGAQHQIGYAALPGLTLLECDVPADDSSVQAVARLVRLVGPKLDATYEISLAILFLDRLGEKRDEALIQTLAARLIAGQAVTGGWGYKCPLTTRQNRHDILLALRKLDPPGFAVLRPPAGGNPQRPGLDQGVAGGKRGLGGFPTGDPRDKGQGVTGKESPQGSIGEQNPSSQGEKSQGGAVGGGPERKDAAPGEKGRPSDSPAAVVGRMSSPGIRCIKSSDWWPGDSAEKAAERPKVSDVVPRYLRNLPVFLEGKRVLVDPPNRDHKALSPTTDNSNTQFAMLALWAAGRHDVSTKRSLDMIVRRFQTSQNADGGWGYRYRYGGGEGPAGGGRGEAPAMTCAGLLGLAIGHGLAGKVLEKEKIDPAVRKGFVALSKHVGSPTGRKDVPQGNLYLLWSIERVAVLYKLPTIAHKDWYRWAAEMLVANQKPEGNWQGGGFWGASPVVDTCFALLVLKRANLAEDLGARLPFDPVELDRAVKTDAGGPMREKPEAPAPPKPPEKPDLLADIGKTGQPPGLSPGAPPSVSPQPAEEGAPAGKPNPRRLMVGALLSVCVLALVAGAVCLLVYFTSRGGRQEDFHERPRPRRRTRFEG
jgi:hypothetical protein